MQVKLYNTTAKEVGEIKLDDAVFACEYNEALIHQAVVAYQANQRQGTKSALTRTEVRGGGIKPWRQKGTGRARQGSISKPLLLVKAPSALRNGSRAALYSHPSREIFPRKSTRK